MPTSLSTLTNADRALLDAALAQAEKSFSEGGVPVNSLWIQWAWTCLLCLSGSYGQLLDYVIFAVLVFYILTIAGLFVLRRTRPDAPRPYRAFGYPLLPALYINPSTHGLDSSSCCLGYRCICCGSGWALRRRTRIINS